MAQIISGSTFNVQNLQADDLYIQVLAPPGFTTPTPTNVVGMIGTASWGPVNTPTLLNSPTDVTTYFGGITAAALTDIRDLPTEATIAFQQASNGGGLQIWGVRVTDGTDVAASIPVKDTTTGTALTGITLTALYTGTKGNAIQIVVAAGGATNTYNVSIIGFAGGISEVFTNIPYTSTGSFWTNLLAAINTGQSGIRGPSKLVKASSANSSAIAPAVSTYTLTGGLDGRSSVVAGTVLGSDTASPRTGAYALRGLTPPVALAWACGSTDTADYSALQALADSEGIVWLFTFATGTSTSSAITAKQGYGIADYNVAFVKDWIYWFDGVNGVLRLVAPLAFAGGRIATLSPAVNPGNKPVYGIVGTERNSPYTGSQPYVEAEVGQLATAGITFITNPCPGGNFFGLRHGQNSNGNGVQSDISYGMLTNYLVNSFAAQLGQFVNQNQSTRANDPLRLAVTSQMSGFLQTLANSNVIDSFSVTCDLTNNTPTTIAQHYLFANVAVKYMSSVRFFVLSLMGGTTVVTTSNSAGGVGLS